MDQAESQIKSEKPPDKPTEADAEKIDQTHEALDQIEARGGEKLGEGQPAKKRGLKARIKEKATKVKQWFLKKFLGLKKRVLALIAKIKAKLIQIVFKVAEAEEPLRDLHTELAAEEQVIPQVHQNMDEGLVAAAQGESLGKQVSSIAEQARKSLVG